MMSLLLIRILWAFLVCRRTTNSLAYSKRFHNLVQAYDVSVHLLLPYCLPINFKSLTYTSKLFRYTFSSLLLWPERICYLFAVVLKMISLFPHLNPILLGHLVMSFLHFFHYVYLSVHNLANWNNYLLIFQ